MIVCDKKQVLALFKKRYFDKRANIASRPTAPVARAGGEETRLGACLLAKGLSTQSARRLMLAVKREARCARPSLNGTRDALRGGGSALCARRLRLTAQ
jgi:hypothetical protein